MPKTSTTKETDFMGGSIEGGRWCDLIILLGGRTSRVESFWKDLERKELRVKGSSSVINQTNRNVNKHRTRLNIIRFYMCIQYNELFFTI